MITGWPFAVYRDGAAAHDYLHVEAFMRAQPDVCSSRWGVAAQRARAQ